MTGLGDSLYNRGVQSGIQQIIIRMLSGGKTPEQISEFCDYGIDEIFEIQASMSQEKKD